MSPSGQQQTWATGDFSRVGASSVLTGELLCEAAGLRAGERVLDVATGSGNTALAAARRACEVVGVDFVPALLERARERAHAERFTHVTFQEGDTEALPFPDGVFDVVLSTSGHMFAPHPAKAASEMARVCRPGGRVAFSCWTPDGFSAGIFHAIGKYDPPPEGVPFPGLWGDEAVVREHFAPYALEFRFQRIRHITRSHSAEYWMGSMREFFGPMRVAWEKLDHVAREAMTRDLLDLVARFNQSGDRTLFVPSEYLMSVVTLK
jgi:ubiquinone/menaquinone biosynthesis C-methylase UbiE